MELENSVEDQEPSGEGDTMSSDKSALVHLYSLAARMWPWGHPHGRNALLAVAAAERSELEIIARLPLPQQKAVLERMGG